MKKLLQFLLLFSAQCAFGQWIPQNIQTTDALTAVHFKNDSIGFTCGQNKIYKTVNGGEDWVVTFEGNSFLQFEAVKTFGNDLIIAGGIDFDSGGTLIVRSENGGDTWTRITAPSFGIFVKSIFFVNQLTVFISGTYGGILKSTDGGLHWTPKSPGTGASFQSIFFRDNQNGFAAGGGIPGTSTLYKSTDGGDNWTEVILNDSSFLQSLFFVDAQTGYIVGWNGSILKTNNGGNTWEHQTSANMQGNLEVFFTDTQTGYIVGGASNAASLQKTTNGGMLWEETGANIPYGLVGIFFPSHDIGYAVGAHGTILKTTSGGASPTIEIRNAEGFKCYPNPVVNYLAIDAGTDKIGAIKIFDNRGVLLRALTIDSNQYAIDFSNEPTGNYYITIDNGNKRGCKKIIKL